MPERLSAQARHESAMRLDLDGGNSRGKWLRPRADGSVMPAQKVAGSMTIAAIAAPERLNSA